MKQLTVLVFCSCVLLARIQAKPNVRIIGGQIARAAQFPYAASIYKYTNAGTYFCAGSIFSNQWILTAGQCVNDATHFQLRIGSNHLEGRDPNAQTLAAEEYVLHPDFNPQTLDNDIGLIKLRIPITFSDYIRSIHLITSIPLDGGTEVLTYGWGQRSDDDAGFSENLMYVTMVTLSNAECKVIYGNQITDSMVCAEGNFNEGTCLGDLGGPILQFGGGSLVYIVGISSFVSGNGCESTDPSGFTRISPYIDWIINVTHTGQ